MILHLFEGADGTRHIHRSDCGDLVFRREAGEVEEIEVADDADEDAIILAVWDDILDPELLDDETLDEHGDRTYFYPCTDTLFGDEESSGNDKADSFMDEAEEAGWAVEFATDHEYVHVKASREFIDLSSGLRCDEILDLAWSPTRLVDAHHLSGLPGEIAKRLSSVKGAITILHSPMPKCKPKPNGRRVEREEPVKRILKEIIPIDLDEAYDDEIIAAVQGKMLVWWNNTAEDYESHYCLPQKNHIKIETGSAGRAILTFISPTGFRSVAIEELIQIK